MTIKRVCEPTISKGPNGQTVKVVWLPENRIRFDIMPGPIIVEAAYLQSSGSCNIQVQYRKKTKK